MEGNGNFVKRLNTRFCCCMPLKGKFATLLCFILSLPLATVAHADVVEGVVVEASTKSAIACATVVLTDCHGKQYSTMTDSRGAFLLGAVPRGSYGLVASFLGYQKAMQRGMVAGKAQVKLLLRPDARLLGEVVVTARESQGITSASVIDRRAIEHIQPSSFADLLALLPGGHTSLPQLTQAHSINLRQAGSGNSNYDIAALGTAFIVDGMPMSSNANMQQVMQASSASNGDPDAGRNHVGAGVDMRTIATDNIEQVEVIRGIAPVEYGDLTSGVVVIKRKLTATPLEFRFKADSYSKLLYAGKGLKRGSYVANWGIDYLDAKADPRNPLNNYKRFTLMARMKDVWKLAHGATMRWQASADYTGSFDNQKRDAEVMKQRADRYKSSYNHWSMSQSLLFTPKPGAVLQSLNLDLAMSYERSLIEQDKEVNLSRDVAVNTSLEAGEHDGAFLPYHYLAQARVDGRPLNLFAKLKGLWAFTTREISHRLNAGVEWRMDKNYGHGQQYDPARPISPGTPYRPRDYNHIPASHQLAAYLWHRATLKAGAHRWQLDWGVRAMQLLHLDARYAMHGTVYLDPRVNASWQLPSIELWGKTITIDLNGGWGRQTKFPTLLQLYPDREFHDIIELNYYNMNPDLRRLYLRTYAVDPVNYGLQPARNDKWEVRLGAHCDGGNVSVTYFRENMSSGFRTSWLAAPYAYRQYDAKAIPPHIDARPDVALLPYTPKVRLGLTGQTTNGSRLLKEGVEFQLSTRRYEALKTRFTMAGAWFKTTYSNSEAMFRYNTSAVVDGVPINDLYLGYYDSHSGSIAEEFNTNFMADSFFPRLGLTFSLTAECTWFTTSRSMRENGVPLAYIDTTGTVHPYTEESAHDAHLQWLINRYDSGMWRAKRVPLGVFVNLKATKNFGKWLRLAFFINRMVDYLPSYTTPSGLLVRRTSKPFFGMEMNVNI